jgi:hypothetical protein
VNSGKLILAAMYLRRVRVVGRSFAAAPTHVSTVVALPASAAQNLGVGPSADLPGADVLRYSLGDDSHCPRATRHAALNRIFQYMEDSNLAKVPLPSGFSMSRSKN